MDSSAGDKRVLRRAVAARRSALTAGDLRAAAEALRAHVLPALDVRRATVVAAYVPVGAEPGDLELLDALRAAGKTVILPVVAPSRRLRWQVYDGRLVSGPWGLREPAGPPPAGPAQPDLGTELAQADLVLAPALAADRAGHRLGRGRGYYDRALDGMRADVRVVVLLHDGELLDRMPHEPHDRPVHAAVTPRGGWTPLGTG